MLKNIFSPLKAANSKKSEKKFANQPILIYFRNNKKITLIPSENPKTKIT